MNPCAPIFAPSYRSEPDLVASFEVAPVAMLVSDADGRFVEGNAAACALLGVSREELVGRVAEDFLPRPEEVPPTQRVTFVAGGRDAGATVIVSGDGARRSVEVVTRALGDAGHVTVLRELTDGRRDADAHAAETTLAAVLESAPLILFTTDRDGLFTLHEGSAVQAGLEHGDLIGQSALELYGTIALVEPGGRTLPGDEALRRVLAGERLRGICDFGSAVYDVQMMPAVGPRGEIDGVLGVAFDITEQRRLERQLSHARKMEAIGLLAGGVAHDFNNMLAAIQGFAGSLADELDSSDPRRQDAVQVLAAAERAAALTRQLLAFSRTQRMTMNVIDLNVAVCDIDRMLRRVISAEIEVMTMLAPALPSIWAGDSHPEQIVLNLALNARDAMVGGGVLTIVTEVVVIDTPRVGLPAGEYVRLTVSDTGVGMDAAVLERIFEPFFSTKGEGGTGLGLPQVYGIVQQCGGHIEVDSAPGQGTRVAIYFPAVAAAPRPRTAARAPAAALASATVLVVEDEALVRTMLVRVLRRGGYQVLEAAGPEAGLAVWERYRDRIAAVVTDVVMPGGGGPAFVERLRAQRPGLAALFISGYADAEVPPSCRDVALLSKPFAPDELLERVQGVLAHRGELGGDAAVE